MAKESQINAFKVGSLISGPILDSNQSHYLPLQFQVFMFL